MKDLIVLITLVLFVTGCNIAEKPSHHGDENTYNRLQQALQEPAHLDADGNYELDLTKVAPFAWDSVYFFIGEEGSKYISNTIGFKWDGSPVPNLYRRLLFVHDKQVVSYIDCPQEENQYLHEKSMNISLFHCNSYRPVLSREQTKFITTMVIQENVISYPLIPVNCFNNFKKLLKHKN